tara:strand:+ start:679 stop:1932 length:1254 start_codon:yes stop_codon:yes gene_type:complete
MSQVTDYNIANASGASVRTDLNAVFDAIKTLNSGGSDPANTEAFMPFVDTGDSNKLKIRNSSNNGFTTIGSVDSPNLGLLATSGGTMTGVLQLPVGSATAPSLHFGQTNTGIFKGSSHRVSFTSDGTQVFFADGTGVNISSTKELRWKDSDNSNYIGFKAANNITNNLTLTLPTADGSSGQALLTNGSGTLSFGAPTVGAANLTGNTLASGVTASSLTSVGTLSSLGISGTCTAGTFSGSGASLTSIPAGQLTGTVADARISTLTASKLTGALPAIDGSSLTGISSVPQCVSSQLSSTFTNSDSPTPREQFQTAFSVSITPSSNSVKLLVMITGHINPGATGSGGSDRSDCIFRCFEGSTAIGIEIDNSDSSAIDQNILRTPNSTATKTYHLKIKSSDDDANVSLLAGATLTILEVS